MFYYCESLVWMHLGFPKIPLFQDYSLAVAIATKTYPFRSEYLQWYFSKIS